MISKTLGYHPVYESRNPVWCAESIGSSICTGSEAVNQTPANEVEGTATSLVAYWNASDEADEAVSGSVMVPSTGIESGQISS